MFSVYIRLFVSLKSLFMNPALLFLPLIPMFLPLMHCITSLIALFYDLMQYYNLSVRKFRTEK